MDEKTIPKMIAADTPALYPYDHLRAEIWKVATETHLTEETLIQRLLGVIGRFFDLDRASFLGLDENKKEYYTKLQWHKPDTGSTLGVTVPYHTAKFFLSQGYMDIPKNQGSDAALFAQETFKRHQIQSYLVLPYGDFLNPTGLFTFSDCRRKREWDEPVKNILAEVVNIISIRTAQIKNEQILLESEERFRLLFEYSNDAVFIHDLQGRILDVNNRACEMLGYDREELKKIPLQALCPAVEWDASRQGLEETRAKGHTRFESCFKKFDGSIVDVEISARVVDPQKGIVQGIARDITERNQAFAMLQETKRKAEASNLAKSEFIANLTHELRTPIAGTIGMLDLTLETTLNPDQRDYLEMARYSITTLSQLINDILDFAKLDVGKLVLQNTPFALPNILETTCLSLALAVKAKGLSLKKEIAPDVPEQLIGDPQRLQQIILKLIGNAIKFTKTGGIFLKIMRSQAPEDLYLMRNDPQKIILHFMVQDTGIGIPLEKLNLIFNAFTQADGSFTRKYGGLGLGLSITQELIKIMGGRIWAQSAPEKGSSFHFTIAFSPANTNEDPPCRAAEGLHHKIR